MSAGGVAALLCWLSCCTSALWRYYCYSPNYLIFSTRSTIILEYEGTSFSEWKVPETCSIEDKRSPRTQLRCHSPGFQLIKPIVTGPDEEERYLSVEDSPICFLWYFRVINFTHNLTQSLILWVYDPENADSSELARTAKVPSLNSMVLTKMLAALGQAPFIKTLLKQKTYFPTDDIVQGTWRITIPMAATDALKMIVDNHIIFQDCFVAELHFLLTAPLLRLPETPHFLPITSPPGSPLISSWFPCLPSVVVVVSDQETFQTNDSFHTLIRVRVPPNILSDDERHSVSDVTITTSGIFFLIRGVLYMKTAFTFVRLGRKNNLPDGGLTGISARKWCSGEYLFKSKGKRSWMATWTQHEVYLAYGSLRFLKVATTAKLKTLLKLSPTATLTIHHVEYTAHPLEIGLLLYYCSTCTATKNVYIVIYNEDTKQFVCQDFTIEIPMDNFFTPYFIFSSMPDVILHDKHRIHYCYQNFTITGILETPTGNGNLSTLSHDSVIQEVYLDYFGNVLIKMENNIIFYSKTNIRDAVKLHLWANDRTKMSIFMSASGEIILVYLLDNGKLQAQSYPLKLEIQSITFKSQDKCPYAAFSNNVFNTFYILDKGENLTLWAEIVYPENFGLFVMVDAYGPKILEQKREIAYEIASGYCTKTMTITFYQSINYEAVNDYFKLQDQNTGTLLVDFQPSQFSKTCAVVKKVFQVAVGCDRGKFIAVKGFNNKDCLHHDFSYVIEKSYLRDRPSENLKVRFDWKKYGCPLKLDSKEKFQPSIQLFNANGFIEDVKANFIVWEIHGRDDYSFNNTMKQSGCAHEAQTWKSMIALNKHLPLDDVWGPENYRHCFSYAIGKPGDLNQPYEIINSSNGNHIYWPMGHSGMYVFRVKILDPNYSYCNLTAIFAVETTGVIPRPNAYLVASLLFVLMLLFLSILVLSYFHYMTIYRQNIYEPLHKLQSKQKKN
ncbi:cation channel sperm-associated protein subunit epsilon [Tupaia chinensis]|uniref:cation channel sperm-associated protein subunit epsilon n=1 Tax=Tupaia chinensis TaxID=246437 RepID=UPI0003C8F8B5|nr:cation channel sperm-associated protein subunit epsilon [Tupaia chinensis]